MVEKPATYRRLRLKMIVSMSEHANEPSKYRWYFAVLEDSGGCVSLSYVVVKCEVQRVQGSDGFFLLPCRRGLIEESLKQWTVAR